MLGLPISINSPGILKNYIYFILSLFFLQDSNKKMMVHYDTPDVSQNDFDALKFKIKMCL